MTVSYTEYEVAAIEARRTKSGYKALVAVGGEAPVDREADLHQEILEYCKFRGWLAFHGSMAHKSRRTAGECDFTILGDKGRFWLIECKTATGKLTIEQQGIARWCEKLGHKVYVIRSFKDFLEVVA